MFSLETIRKMNRPRAVASSRRRARALNNPSGHAKDKEKGRVMTIDNADQIEAAEIRRDYYVPEPLAPDGNTGQPDNAR